MDVVLYNTEDGKVRFEVQLDRETVWLNQRQMAELFDKDIEKPSVCISAPLARV